VVGFDFESVACGDVAGEDLEVFGDGEAFPDGGGLRAFGGPIDDERDVEAGPFGDGAEDEFVPFDSECAGGAIDFGLREPQGEEAGGFVGADEAVLAGLLILLNFNARGDGDAEFVFDASLGEFGKDFGEDGVVAFAGDEDLAIQLSSPGKFGLHFEILGVLVGVPAGVAPGVNRSGGLFAALERNWTTGLSRRKCRAALSSMRGRGV
jgi:hypothetical protein